MVVPPPVLWAPGRVLGFRLQSLKAELGAAGVSGEAVPDRCPAGIVSHQHHSTPQGPQNYGDHGVPINVSLPGLVPQNQGLSGFLGWGLRYGRVGAKPSSPPWAVFWLETLKIGAGRLYFSDLRVLWGAPGGCHPQPPVQEGTSGLDAPAAFWRGGTGHTTGLCTRAPHRDPKIVPEHPQQGANWALWDPPTPQRWGQPRPPGGLGQGRGGGGGIFGGVPAGGSRASPPVLFAA